jgi:hypothetical protein
MASYSNTMATTIQVSTKLLKELKDKKLYEKESYEEVIWSLLEDTMEISEETKRRIAKAETEFREGKFVTHEQVKQELGL